MCIRDRMFSETGDYALTLIYIWVALRLATESGVYTLLMVIDSASYESLTRLFFKEKGEEFKLSKKRSFRMPLWRGCSDIESTFCFLPFYFLETMDSRF